MCRKVVQEVFQRALKEVGPDSLVTIDASSDPYSIIAMSRLNLVSGLFEGLEQEEAAALKIIENPAPKDHFYVLIFDNTETYSCFEQAVQTEKLPN